MATEDELLEKIALYKVQMYRTCELFRETDSMFKRGVFREHIKLLEKHVADLTPLVRGLE